MITFRGSKKQVRLLEMDCMTKDIIKVSSGDNIPLFEEQKNFQSLVTYREYLIRTDNKKGFLAIPDIYKMKFVYFEDEERGEVHMLKEVVDKLLESFPEQIRALDIIVGENNGQDKDKKNTMHKV